MQHEQAKDRIRKTLKDVKSYLAQEKPRKLSEADTKAFFIEPIVAALGWHGIGVVVREYYVKNSQEFIDYVMNGPGGPLLAIEAKPLQSDLTEKNAAQLIQYCAVEGIEWAALSNGHEIQFFNTYLKGDLDSKRIFRLDLLAYNNDAEFDALYDMLNQLSRESMTTPEGVRTWLKRRRMDAGIRSTILSPSSPAVRAIRKSLEAAEIRVSPQEIAQWFASHLDSVLAGGLPPVAPEVKPPSGKKHYSVKLADLLAAGIVPPQTELRLIKGGQQIASATLDPSGAIVYDGKRYKSPSDKTFAKLFGGQSLNGWQHWFAILPEGRVSLIELRARLLG